MKHDIVRDGIERHAYNDQFFTTPPLQVVLVEPEIPPNTGSIGRVCVATRSTLHLIEPLGFKIDEKSVRRAGLDYWHKVDVHVHKSLDDVIGPIIPPERCFFLSTRAKMPYWDIPFQPGDALILGKESTGLGPELTTKYADQLYNIPLLPGSTRSLNIANAASIVIYDGYRRLAGMP